MVDGYFFALTSTYTVVKKIFLDRSTMWLAHFYVYFLFISYILYINNTCDVVAQLFFFPSSYRLDASRSNSTQLEVANISLAIRIRLLIMFTIQMVLICLFWRFQLYCSVLRKIWFDFDLPLRN